MHGVPLVENEGTATVTSTPAAGQTRDHSTQGEQVSVQFGGPQGEPVVRFGSLRLGYDDIFLLLVTLQTVGILLETYRVVTE